MRRFILSILALCVALPLFAGQTIRILPREINADINGSTERLIKRIPSGSTFLLTVNEGKDVRYYDIQWYKDGVAIEGATSQELRYPFASSELEGEYTVQMSSPCATVMSKPMNVIVEARDFAVNSETSSDFGVAGHVDATTSVEFVLEDCKPNPVTDLAKIEFTSTGTSPVTLKVVDLNGSVIATLINDVLPAGSHDVTMNTAEYNMSSTLYYFVLSAPGYTATKPMMLVR